MTPCTPDKEYFAFLFNDVDYRVGFVDYRRVAIGYEACGFVVANALVYGSMLILLLRKASGEIFGFFGRRTND